MQEIFIDSHDPDAASGLGRVSVSIVEPGAGYQDYVLLRELFADLDSCPKLLLDQVDALMVAIDLQRVEYMLNHPPEGANVEDAKELCAFFVSNARCDSQRESAKYFVGEHAKSMATLPRMLASFKRKARVVHKKYEQEYGSCAVPDATLDYLAVRMIDAAFNMKMEDEGE